MAQVDSLWRRAMDLARLNGAISLITAGTFVLLAVPDFLFHRAGYQTAAVLSAQAMTLALLLSVCLTLIRSRRRRLTALGLLLASQAVWLGCLAYFGRPLGPEQLLLAANEAADVTAGIIDGWRTLLPALATVAATGALLVLLQGREVGPGTLRDRPGGWLFIVLAVALAGYWMTHRNVVVTIPGAQTFSALGPYQATVSAARLLLTPVAASPDMKIANQAVTPAPIEEDPVTVIVIMGEGITPSRLSLFGFAGETTPRLAGWRTAPPEGFELIAKIGFSGGVATFGSVPAFLKMSYWPVEAEWRGVTLFDLAHAGGFKSWFFSAQSRHFLDVAGGARGAERVVAEQGNEQRLAERHDDMLVDLASEVPVAPRRRFVFFHQRVNHSNYTSHCSHLPPQEQSQLYMFHPASASREDSRRAAYDNGLRCWDKNVADLAQVFTAQPGAVHVFITADHSEMMGEGGMWGHSMADLRVAQVPVLLLTNRPQSDIAKRFNALSPPNWYTLAQLVARALGQQVATPGARDGRFYLNTTMPFGRSGYFEVESTDGANFKARQYTREGKLRDETVVELTGMRAANAGATKAH